jgi:cardiolipin synthase
VTSWGKLADPLADKLIQLTALVILTIMNMIPFFVIIIVAIKEVFMGIGSIVLYKQKNFVVSANWYGKAATVIFYLSVIMIIIINNMILRDVFISIAVLSTLIAFVMYIGQFRKIKSSTDNAGEQ